MRLFLNGFTLIDVLIAVTLCSLLVLLLGTFLNDVFQYSKFLSQHQQIRTETFALVNNTLASLIREATAIDYSKSSDGQLSLFMDKYEKFS